MKMDKPTHNMSPRRRGDDLTASTINQLMAKIRASIVGGKGILIRRGGDQIIIETARGGIGGSNGGAPSTAAPTLWYTAASKATLTDASTVSATALARVQSETSENGMVCIVNPDGDGWDAINFCE